MVNCICGYTSPLIPFVVDFKAMGAHRQFLVVLLLNLLGITVSSGADSEAKDVFDLDIEDLVNISINAGSRLLHDAAQQPASVTVISRQQIAASGARTLSDVITLYTPGYFRTEDQDDVIAGFRGLSPDNNSKVLFLVDGRSVNAEWFWGAPDALLNGQDLHWIERIEIVRGPGSAILGQGALLGVINIVTLKSNVSRSAATLHADYGNDGLRQWAINWNVLNDGAILDGYSSVSGYRGEIMANEGWVRDRATDNGTVFSLQHRLQRAQGSHHAIRYNADDLIATYRQVRQRRDLYNFYRERDEVEQTLQMFDLAYHNSFGTELDYAIDVQHNTDDYDLYSHDDTDMGGVRERRNTIQLLVRPDVTEEFFQWLVGAEYRAIHSGLTNAQGNNYIINEPDALHGQVNQANTYVYDSKLSVRSVFGETSLALNERNDVYLGARVDEHPEWGNKLTPRASWFHQISAEQHFRVSYQQGFRGAVGVHYAGGFRGDGLLSEGNFDRVNDNIVLQERGFSNLEKTTPEEIRALELNYSGTFDTRWRWSVTGFQQTIRNIIDVGVIYVDPTDLDISEQSIGSDVAGSWNGFFYFKNTPGKLKGRGVESEIRYERPSLNVVLSHAYVEVVDAPSEQTTGSMYVVNNPAAIHFKTYPEKVWRLNGRYALNHDWTLHYAHVHASNWWSPSGDKQTGLGWGNLTVEWQPLTRARVQMTLHNVWDQNALYPFNNNAADALISQSGTPALAGRALWLSLTIGPTTR